MILALLADYSDGIDKTEDLTDDEIRAHLDALERLQREGEAAIRLAAQAARAAQNPDAAARCADRRERLTRDQRERADLRRALQRQLQARKKRVNVETLKAALQALAEVERAMERIPEEPDEDDIEQALAEIDAAYDALDEAVPGWREVSIEA